MAPDNRRPSASAAPPDHPGVESMSEKRLHQRLPLLKPGRLTHSSGLEIAFQVVDVSSGGFCIEVGPQQPVWPTGWINCNGQTQPYVLAWRRGTRAGLRIEEAEQPKLAPSPREGTAPCARPLSIAALRNIAARAGGNG